MVLCARCSRSLRNFPVFYFITIFIGIIIIRLIIIVISLSVIYPPQYIAYPTPRLMTQIPVGQIPVGGAQILN